MLDGEHVDPSGYHFSDVVALDGTGRIYGTSSRYVGGLYRGETIWRYDPANTTTIAMGLTDAEHTSASGVRLPRIVKVQPDGRVLGVSVRYNGGWQQAGASGWYFDSVTGVIHNLGLTEGLHTSSQGTRATHPLAALADGRVLGYSTQYGPSQRTGTTLWAWSPSTGTYEILGPLGPAYRDPASGLNRSHLVGVTTTGRVLGQSDHTWTGHTFVETSTWAWLPSDGSMIHLGLSSPDYLGSSGLANSELNYYTFTADVVRGMSRRRSPDEYSPWSANLATGLTHALGLNGAPFLNPAGARENWASSADVAGRYFGTAERFMGNVPSGETAWVQVPGSPAAPIVHSIAVNGYSYTDIYDLDESGTALGVYRDCASGTPGSFRAFWWAEGVGLRPIDELVVGGLESAGYGVAQYEDGGNALWFGINQELVGQMHVGPADGSAAVLLLPRPACDPDFTCDGNADQDDVICMINVVAGNGGCECQDPDFNRDGNVDQDDVIAMIGVVAGGPCP